MGNKNSSPIGHDGDYGSPAPVAEGANNGKLGDAGLAASFEIFSKHPFFLISFMV